MSLSAPFLASKKEEIAKASGACLTLYPAEGVKRMSVAFSLFEELEKKENSRIRERVSVYGVEEEKNFCPRGSVVRRERQDEDDLRPFNEMRSRGSLRIRRGIGKNRGFVTCRVWEWKGEELQSFLASLCTELFPLSIGKFKTSFKNNFFSLTKEKSIENVIFHDIED